ncbi:MAG: type II secretion system protein [Mariprofundales bacterium]
MRNRPITSSHGFTLIEIIGVLAIMSIMAATIAPSAIQMITAGKQTSEDKALAAISDSLRLFVQTKKQVPGATAALPISGGTNVIAWDKAIASIMNVPSTKVSTNNINKKRIYLYPADFIAASTPVPPLPYDQIAEATNLNGSGKLITTKPDPRVMVISNMNPGVTLATASGSKAIDLFNAIWNQATVNGTTLPAELTEGDKLKIARINMTDMFHLKSLKSGVATDPYTAAIQVDGLPASPYTWTADTSIQFYLLAGSVLTLGYNDATPTFYTYDNNVVSSQQPNFYYSSGVWGASQLDPYTAPVNGGATGVASVTDANGVFNQWGPKPNCTQSPAALVIDNIAGNQVTDYNVFSGDVNGTIIDRDRGKTGDATYFASTGVSAPGGYTTAGGNNINKTRNAAAFNTCDMVIVVPKANNGNGVKVYLFYMPTTATESSPYEITVP